MFSMALSIRETFGFADYDPGAAGVQVQIHILVVLLIYY